jgi:prepilin-type N-terminal cleavage/methylation domain-containing protein
MGRACGRARREGRARSGFTLIEILIAASAMLIALLGFSQALIATMRAQDLTRQQTLAMEAARRTIEEMRNINFRDAFRQYNGFPTTTWPDLALLRAAASRCRDSIRS